MAKQIYTISSVWSLAFGWQRRERELQRVQPEVQKIEEVKFEQNPKKKTKSL